MHLINLDDNTVIEYAAATHIRDVEHNNHDAASYMRDAVTKAADPRYKREMLEFTDLTTLPKRMSGIRNISQEFLSSYVGWVREEFIAIDRHEDGTLASVIFTTQIINAQKLKEEKLIHKSITDEITGLLNRRAYEEDLLKIEHTRKTVPFVLVAMDVNGLKTVNDTLGHAAGDELIQGASFCIRTCFGDYGKIYRIGGDEFMAILTQGCEKVEELLLNLKKAAASWSGKQIQELAISAGYARSTELQDAEMEAYEELADKRMYDAKAQYYAGKGVDRRGRKEFLDLICKSYTYILSVNLTNNSFAVIHAADEENLQNPGYHGNFSEWMSHFVDTGQVCEEDRQEYFNQTHLDELKTFFRGKNERMVIKYRSMPDGNYVHILMEMIKTKNYTEDHQEIFLYVKPIDA
jgi:diguanylate cyclase (GGDEF)-like protein